MMNKEQIQKFEETKRLAEERTLKSIEESLRVLNETERIGVACAVNLIDQGEKLKKIDNQLDSIDNTLDKSQKNLTGIKSVFGSFTNLFSKKDKSLEDLDQKAGVKMGVNKPMSSLQEKIQYNTKAINNPGTLQKTQQPASDSKTSDFDSKLNSNMDDISKSVSLLKSLATGLGEELDDQDVLIEKINVKTEKVNIKMEQQNKEIQKLLR